MKFVDKAIAKLALVSAQAGAGSASIWTAHQPKEPDMKNINK